MKRLFDIIVSACGLLVLSPVFLIMAIWIKQDSNGPVFYRQVRVGRHNKDFRIFKFRSMRVGADKGSLVTIGGRDPRITRSGYFISKYKLDEFPQLINLLLGTTGPLSKCISSMFDLASPIQPLSSSAMRMS